ncbi:Agamous-like MADS-box protein AGL14, partial [Mucuna pruriens]
MLNVLQQFTSSVIIIHTSNILSCCGMKSVVPKKLLILLCSSINKTVERYQRKKKDLGVSNKGIQENTQHLKEGDNISMAKKIKLIEDSRRKLLGYELDTSGIDELQQLENQLQRSLDKIRARKENRLLEVNKGLREQYRMERQRSLSEQDVELVTEKGGEEVETELFIGRPERRMALKLKPATHSPHTYIT